MYEISDNLVAVGSKGTDQRDPALSSSNGGELASPVGAGRQ